MANKSIIEWQKSWKNKSKKRKEKGDRCLSLLLWYDKSVIEYIKMQGYFQSLCVKIGQLGKKGIPFDQQA